MNDKSNLSAEELETLNIEFAKRGKSPGILWLLWLFLGVFGAHRFYLGNKVGWLYIALILLAFPTKGITLGATALLVLIDAFANNRRLAVVNERIEASVLSEIMEHRQSEVHILAVAGAEQNAVSVDTESKRQDGCVVCQKCGAALIREISPETGEAQSSPRTEASSQSDAKDARNGCILMVVLAILVVLGIRGCVRWLFPKEDKTASQTSSMETQVSRQPKEKIAIVGYRFDSNGAAYAISAADLEMPVIANAISASLKTGESIAPFETAAFQTIDKAEHARKREMEHAFAGYSINFRTGYESLTVR